MSTPELLSLSVDPDPARYMRLRAACSCDHRIHLVSCRSFSAAKEVLALNDPQFSMVFVAQDLPAAETKQFVSESKATPRGQTAAYILVIDSSDTSTKAISERLVDGFDGFLRAPYSVDAVLEVMELSARITKQLQDNRQKMAIQIALVDVLTFIDSNADAKRKGLNLAVREQSVKRLKETLQRVYENDEELFYEVVTETFARLADYREKEPNSKAYKGASARVKKRMRKKILEEQAEKTPSGEILLSGALKTKSSGPKES